MPWSRFERVELLLILAASVTAWCCATAWQPSLGTALCYGAALIRGQGLLRDLCHLALTPRSGARRKIACLCAESSLGATMILAGLVLLLMGVSATVHFSSMALTGAIAGLLLLGFIAKDYVIVIKKEKDHASVVLW